MLRHCTKITRKSILSRSITSFQHEWGSVLDGNLPQNADFKANKAAMDGLVENLRKTVGKIHEGGGAKACAKHKSRQKLLARERINALVDVGSPFLELSPLAGHGTVSIDLSILSSAVLFLTI